MTTYVRVHIPASQEPHDRREKKLSSTNPRAPWLPHLPSHRPAAAVRGAGGTGPADRGGAAPRSGTCSCQQAAHALKFLGTIRNILRVPPLSAAIPLGWWEPPSRGGQVKPRFRAACSLRWPWHSCQPRCASTTALSSPRHGEQQRFGAFRLSHSRSDQQIGAPCSSKKSTSKQSAAVPDLAAACSTSCLTLPLLISASAAILVSFARCALKWSHQPLFHLTEASGREHEIKDSPP